MGRRKVTVLVFVLLLATFLLPGVSLAEEASAGDSSGRGLIALAIGLGLGAAAFGTAFGQGRATAAAMESIGRNPNSADRIQTPLVLGLAFMEALTLYMWVIAFFLQGKI